MQADLVIPLQVNGFASLTLTFWYWIKTESGGGDWIQAWYDAGGIQTNIFNPRGSSADKWVNETVAVPTNIDRLIIRFTSDSTNHGFEGAYIDDVILVGVEDVPPTSTVLPLPTHTTYNPLAIPYVAQDNPNGSGVAYVELWYRHGTSGIFTLYNASQNRLGEWTTPTIPFDVRLAAGDGYYEFYTIAVDKAQNREAPPATADASTTFDPAPFPWLLIGIILAILIGGLLLFLWWKRRRDEEEEEGLTAAVGAVAAPKTPKSREEAEEPAESEEPLEMPEEMPPASPP
jgi:hypothetical protein